MSVYLTIGPLVPSSSSVALMFMTVSGLFWVVVPFTIVFIVFTVLLCAQFVCGFH